MIASAASTRHSRLDSPRLMLYRRNHGKGEPVSKRRVGPDYFARGEFGGKISKAFILRGATLIVSESYFCPIFGGEGTKSGFSRCNGGEKKGGNRAREELFCLFLSRHTRRLDSWFKRRRGNSFRWTSHASFFLRFTTEAEERAFYAFPFNASTLLLWPCFSIRRLCTVVACVVLTLLTSRIFKKFLGTVGSTSSLPFHSNLPFFK